MKTIPRNATRQIAALRERITHVTLHSLRNNFLGQEVTTEAAFKELQEYSFARLVDEENDRTATIYVHSNRWFTLHLGA